MYFRDCKQVEMEAMTNEWQVKLLNHALSVDRVEASWVYACGGGADWAERLLDSLHKTGKTGQRCLQLFTDIGQMRRRANYRSHFIIFRMLTTAHDNGFRHHTEEHRIDHFSGEQLLPIYYISRI